MQFDTSQVNRSFEARLKQPVLLLLRDDKKYPRFRKLRRVTSLVHMSCERISAFASKGQRSQRFERLTTANDLHPNGVNECLFLIDQSGHRKCRMLAMEALSIIARKRGVGSTICISNCLNCGGEVLRMT